MKNQIPNTRDINFLQNIASKYQGKVLSDQYIRNNTKYKWQCKCGNIFERRFWNMIENDSFCPLHKNEIISKKRIELFKKDISFLQNLALSKKGQCLSKEYITADMKYQWQCEYGHIWNARYNTVKNHWCPYCCKSSKKDINWLHSLASDNNGKCLSKNYINRNSLYEWECVKGHKWSTTAGTISLGAWCPVCIEHRGPKEITKKLDNLFVEYKKEYLLPCKYKRRLRADFFLPKYNCIVEYDGIQHFKQYIKGNRKISLDTIQIRDQIKNKYCEENNITLIRIPYTEFKNIEAIIQTEYDNGFSRSFNLSEKLLEKLEQDTL